MKNNILFICKFLIFSFFCFSCENDMTLEQKMIKYEENKGKSWHCAIDSIFEGNFTDSGYREVLVFFNLMHKKENAKTYDSKLFVIDNEEKILNVYDAYCDNHIIAADNYIRNMEKLSCTSNNALITDFNKNNKLEIIYFVPEGSLFVFYIDEFKDGAFHHICRTYNSTLRTSGIDNFDVTHFDFEKKSIFLDERHTNKKIKLIWNPETEFYDEEVLQE